MEFEVIKPMSDVQKRNYDAALANPDAPESKELIKRASSKGFIRPVAAAEQPAQPKETTKMEHVGGAAVGALEAFNLLSIPRTVETLGASAVKAFSEDSPRETRSGMIIPQGSRSFSEIIGETDSEPRFFPDLSVQRGVKAFGGGDFIDRTRTAQTVGGVAAAIGSLGLGARGLIKGGPGRQAARLTKDVKSTIKTIVGVGEGAEMTAIVTRPGKVKALLSSGQLRVTDLADSLQKSLVAVVEKASKLVGEYKNPVMKGIGANSKPSIETSGFKSMIKEAQAGTTTKGQQVMSQSIVPEKSALLDSAGRPIVTDKAVTTVKNVGKKELLTAGDQRILNDLNEVLAVDKLTPRDAMILVNKIDEDYVKWSATPGGNISAVFENSIKRIRGMLKDSIRNSTPTGEAWAKADDTFATLKGNRFSIDETKRVDIDDLVRSLSGPQKDSKVKNMLNETNDPTRLRVAKALDIFTDLAKQDKPSIRFFNRLAETKAAGFMESMGVNKFDKVSDQVERALNYWVGVGRDFGSAVGHTIGATGGGFVGHIAGGPLSGAGGSLMGSIIFGGIGKRIGGLGGRLAGQAKLNPLNVLAKAEKAKVLSANAKRLAKDFSFIGKNLGEEGMNVFQNMIPAGIPATNELTAYVRAQSQELPGNAELSPKGLHGNIQPIEGIR